MPRDTPAPSEADELVCASEKPASTARRPRSGFRPHPQLKSGFTAFPVKDELVLLADAGDKVFALNSTSAAIWNLCDGRHSLEDIFTELRDRFSGDSIQIMSDISAALFQFREMELLEEASLSDPRMLASGVMPVQASSDRPRLRIVLGIEDTVYFHWQLAIMFESLVGQMAAGWEVNVVVCNNHEPISGELTRILAAYGVLHYTGDSPADNNNIDFAGGGDRYVPLNRVEALNVVSRHAAPDDLLCLMDTDIFLYGDLQEELFPRGNAMASNWIIGQERYFQFSAGDTKGLSLPKLLEALGCEAEFKPGGVMVFLTAESLQKNDRKLIRDCFRFLQILYLAGKILELPPHGVWVAEMACFALAMYPSEIDYELLEIEQFAVQEQNADALPEGSFFHYYADINDGGPGPFLDSPWNKQLYRDSNFLEADIDGYLQSAKGGAERQFMLLALNARERIYGRQDS